MKQIADRSSTTLALAVLSLALVSCATRLEGPRAVTDPVDVYLMHRVNHAAILLPDQRGGLVEYAYGEWDWFALERQGWRDALAAILWPTPGALGRYDVPLVVTIDAIEQSYDGTVTRLRVERAAVDRLLERLEDRWLAGGEAVERTPGGMQYVQDDLRYHLFNTCATETARWLEALGCSVGGPAIVPRFAEH